MGEGGDQAEMLNRLVTRVATLECAVGQGNNARRTLHNQLVELRGNVSCLAPCNLMLTGEPSPSCTGKCWHEFFLEAMHGTSRDSGGSNLSV